MVTMNIIMIMSDSFRQDHLGCYGNDWINTPNLDKLAGESVLFENAYSNGCTTRFSIPSLFTSNPITSTGIWSWENVLPESLFLYYAGEKPRRKSYDLLKEYRKVLNDEAATLPGEHLSY